MPKVKSCAAPAGPAVIANNDAGKATAGSAATLIKNLVSNDTFDGEAATLGEGANVTLATVDTWPSGIELDPLTGTVTILADAAPGQYKLEYQICEVANPNNCDTAVVELFLGAPPVTPAFPTGDGLSSSVCEATPATNAFQDIGLRWTYNQNGGTSPNAEIAVSYTHLTLPTILLV